MQLGFVIDHGRCIGCHACTVACKAENDVPLGSFRTWVKYTERGRYPDVRRNFAVLRCNQCSAAPCVTICPVRALHKRPDGIVDIDPAACIGCKACMQACPYDALYLNDERGVAEKCHFCAHRVEVGLAPACAVVCPTEAIVPGDLDDPTSVVAGMRRDLDLAVRKPEAGTRPNVYYRDVDRAGIEPMTADASGGYLWSGRGPGVMPDVERFQAELEDADRRARTTYDVDHRPLWGARVSAYVATKSIAAGAFLALPALLLARGGGQAAGRALVALPAIALIFLALTAALLIADLGRPARFLYLLLRPNPGSWLVRGGMILGAYGAVLVAWLVALALEPPGGAGTRVLLPLGIATAAATAAYTGWLFGQAHGRVLWMQRGLWARFLLHAGVAGGATTLLAAPWLALSAGSLSAARWLTVGSLVADGLFGALVGLSGPRHRAEEFRRAVALLHGGPFAATRRLAHLGAWLVALPALVVFPVAAPARAWPFWALGAAVALVCMAVDQHLLVRAGQAPPIS